MCEGTCENRPLRLNSMGGQKGSGGGGWVVFFVVRQQRVAQRNRDRKEVPATGVSLILNITARNETNIMHILSKDPESPKCNDRRSKQSLKAAGGISM